MAARSLKTQCQRAKYSPAVRPNSASLRSLDSPPNNFKRSTCVLQTWFTAAGRARSRSATDQAASVGTWRADAASDRDQDCPPGSHRRARLARGARVEQRRAANATGLPPRRGRPVQESPILARHTLASVATGITSTARSMAPVRSSMPMCRRSATWLQHAGSLSWPLPPAGRRHGG